VSVAWFRKDNRVVSQSVAEGEIYVLDLQAKGTEPLIVSNSGADLKVAYNRGGPYFLIPDGYQYTWEVKHPFNSELYLFNDTTTAATTISFIIGGSMYDE
jgi:hypothetical protein